MQIFDESVSSSLFSIYHTIIIEQTRVDEERHFSSNLRPDYGDRPK